MNMKDFDDGMNFYLLVLLIGAVLLLGIFGIG